MPWHAKAQVLLSFCLILLLSSKRVSGNAEKENAEVYAPTQIKDKWDNTQSEDIERIDKRGSWKNFQGSWGKRSDDKDSWQNDAQIEGEELFKRGGWSNLHGTWGKREQEMHPDIENIARKVYELYKPDFSEENNDRYMAVPLKRTWANFAGTWGKRPYGGSGRAISPRSTNWSSLRGSWGKRADWSALRGAWGKRST